jgi:L-alanine-DL-glutamate epimerase-like enolase superfamily enzyme
MFARSSSTSGSTGRSVMRKKDDQSTFVLVETDAGITGLGDAFGDQALMPTIIEQRSNPRRGPRSDGHRGKLVASRAF